MFKELNVLKPFLEEPSREFNVREAGRILRLAPATASKELKAFAKKGILKERKEKGFNFYKANLENEAYKDLKVYYNLRKIKDSGLLEAINRFYLKPTIVLFGSAASGLDTETSDFDMLIVTEKTNVNLALSVRNLPYVDIINCENLNTFDLTTHDVLIATCAAIKRIEETYA